MQLSMGEGADLKLSQGQGREGRINGVKDWLEGKWGSRQ